MYAHCRHFETAKKKMNKMNYKNWHTLHYFVISLLYSESGDNQCIIFHPVSNGSLWAIRIVYYAYDCRAITIKFVVVYYYEQNILGSFNRFVKLKMTSSCETHEPTFFSSWFDILASVCVCVWHLKYKEIFFFHFRLAKNKYVWIDNEAAVCLYS